MHVSRQFFYVILVSFLLLLFLGWLTKDKVEGIIHENGAVVNEVGGVAPSTTEEHAVLDNEELLNRAVGKYINTKGEKTDEDEIATSLNYHLNEISQLVNRLDEADEENRLTHIGVLLESKKSELITVKNELDRWLDKKDLNESDLAKAIDKRFTVVGDLIDSLVTAPSDQARKSAVQQARETLVKYRSPQAGERGEPSAGFSIDTPTELSPDELGSALPEMDLTNSEIIVLAESYNHSYIEIYSHIKKIFKFEFYFGFV